MYQSGLMHPTDQIPVFTDTVGSVNLTTAGAAFDYPAGAGLMLIVANLGFMFNGATTQAGTPSSNSSGTTLSSMRNEYIPPNVPQWRQITAGSTGYSVAATSAAASGILTIDFFHK